MTPDQSLRRERLKSLLKQNDRRLHVTKLTQKWARINATGTPVDINTATCLARAMPSLEREDFGDFEDMLPIVVDFVRETETLLVGDFRDRTGTSFVKIDRDEFLALLDRMEDIYLFGFTVTFEGGSRFLFIDSDFDSAGWYYRYAIKEGSADAPNR